MLSKLQKHVKSGATHPIALVRDDIISLGKVHPIWQEVNDDLSFFPWPNGRTLFDLVAHVCQKHFLPLGISTKHYYNLVEKVEIFVFGRTCPDRT